MNGLAAAAVGRAFGIPWENITNALLDFSPVNGRSTLRKLGEILVLDDSYNANPSSVILALETLKKMSARHRFVVLGDMLELGIHSEREHRLIGDTVATMGFDGFLAFGPEMSVAVECAINQGLTNARHFEIFESLSQTLLQEVHPGDAVLVKGSRGMQMERAIDYLEKNLEKGGQ